MKLEKPIQDYYPDELSYCYGCGRLNEHGLHIQSFWDGEKSIARFTPEEYHIAIPGFVYGGLLASLIDCHGTGTAAAAAYQAQGRIPGTEPHLRFVTASLKVDFLKPTPLGVELMLVGTVKEITGRKGVVEIELLANHQVCVKGEVVAVEIASRKLPNK